jgi:hypothetical protein
VTASAASSVIGTFAMAREMMQFCFASSAGALELGLRQSRHHPARRQIDPRDRELSPVFASVTAAVVSGSSARVLPW